MSVAAEEVVTAVQTYADRLHDLLRRRGLPSPDAVAVVTRSAQDLVDGAAGQDVTADPTGWWWARALSLSARAYGKAEPPERADRVEDALAELAEPLRLAVLLRDTYDLPIASVTTALGVGATLTNERVLRGRLELVRLLDGEAPELSAEPTGDPEHLDPAQVVGVADGALPPAEIARSRRHLRACERCDGLVSAAQRGRRLIAALPLMPMEDGPRDALIESVRERAGSALPSLADVLLAREVLTASTADRSLIPIPLILVALVGALLLGAITGAVTAPSGDSGRTAIDDPGALPTESADPSPSTLPTSTPTPTAVATATAVPTTQPTRTASATTPPPTSRPPVTGPAAISLNPSSGPNDTDITVSGSGWTPGSTVVVSYLDTLGQAQSSASAVVGSSGRFRVTVVAHDPLNLPGRHTVRASDGSRTATASYNAQ